MSKAKVHPLEHPAIKPIVKQLNWHVGEVVRAERCGESDRIHLVFENGVEHVLVFCQGEWKLGFRENISAEEMLEVLSLQAIMRCEL